MVSLSKQFSLATVTGLALLCLCAPVWSADGRIQGIHYDAGTRHFRIDSAGNVKATVNTLNIAGHKRIIIDMDNAEIGTELPRDVQILHDLSRQLPDLTNVTVNQYAGNGRPIVRILMDIKGDPGSVRLISNQGSRIELELNESANTARRNPYAQPPSLSGYQQPTSTVYRSPNPAPTYAPPSSTRSAQPPVASDLRDDDIRRSLVILNQKYENSLQENQYLRAKLSSAEQGQNNRQVDQQQARDEQSRLQAEINRLKNSNNALQSQINNWQTRQTQPDPNLALKQSEIDRLKSENQSLNNRLASALAAPKGVGTDDLKRTLSEMNRRYELLAQENQNLQGKIASQNASFTANAANKAEVERLTQEKLALSNENSRLKSQLETRPTPPVSSISDTDLQALRRQVTVAQSSLSESIRTINEQNKEIAYLRNQVNDVKAGMDSSSREQTATLQSRLDEKEMTIQTLQRQLAQKATVVPSNTAELSSLKRQMEQLTQRYQADVQELNRQLKFKNDQLVQANAGKANVADLQREVQDLSDRLAVSNTRLTEAQNLASKAAVGKVPVEEVTRKDAQIAGLEKEIAALKTAQASTSKNQQEQVVLLQQENAKLKSAAQAGETAKKELAAIQLDLQNLKKASASIKGNPADKATIAQLTQSKQSLQDELDSLKMAQQQSAGNEATARQLKDQLASAELELSSLKGKYEQAAKEASQAKQALQAAQNKNAPKAVATGGKVDPAQAAQLSKLNQQISDLRKENTNLRETLSARPVGQKTSSNQEAEQDYQAAKTALNGKNMETALSKFKEALLLDPDNSKYATDYSIALAEDHQYAEAIDTLRRYLQRNPGDRDAYNQLGKIYLLNDQADAANQAFTRAIPISVLNNYATSLKKLGNMGEAESVFKMALAMNPKDSEVLFNLGNLYNAENKLEQARNKYLEALQVRPEFAEAHYNLGLIFAKLGDKPKAISHLERFLQLSPNARNAETIRGYLQSLKA